MLSLTPPRSPPLPRTPFTALLLLALCLAAPAATSALTFEPEFWNQHLNYTVSHASKSALLGDPNAAPTGPPLFPLVSFCYVVRVDVLIGTDDGLLRRAWRSAARGLDSTTTRRASDLSIKPATPASPITRRDDAPWKRTERS
jgi:hypothetical protein